MPAAPKIEIRIPRDLGLTRKQAKELENLFQAQLADVLKGAEAAAKNKLVHPEPRSSSSALAARAKSKSEVV
jgi:hypothetical protein